MSAVTVTTEPAEEEAPVNIEENLLLQKLLEQNRLLEEDHKFRTGSTCSDSTSLNSADSVGSLRVSTALSPIPSSGSQGHSPLLTSPRPHPSQSDDSGSEESLGPGASVLLDDDLDTEISYDVPANTGEVGVAEVGLKKMPTISASDVRLVLEEDSKEVTVPVRRFRSDTESAVKRISLASLVGRKRTMTMAETTAIVEEPGKPREEVAPVRTAEEEVWHKWSEILRNWGESAKKKMTVIKQLARHGIPDPLRPVAWQLLSGPHNMDLKDDYPALITEESPFEKAIQRDLNRTFPEHSFFKESDGLGQEGLLNILKAYSLHDKEVGYCQGTPFVAGLLLMKMPEEEAFCVFVSLMNSYKLRELFKPSMADLSLCFYIFEKTLQELFPDLHTHFRAVGFQTSMYASPWFLTLFGSILSLDVVFRIMDLFLLEGRDVIFRIGLALIEYNIERLVRGDLEEILKYFQKGMRTHHEGQANRLIQRAYKIKLSHKKMKKLEKEYLARKEKDAHVAKIIEQLEADNSSLVQRVCALEKECASLADRLIHGQVTLAQDAEEKLILKKQLAVAERKLGDIEIAQDLTPSEAGQENGDNLGPEEQYFLVRVPTHLSKEEAEEILRLGSPPQGLPLSPPADTMPTDNTGHHSEPDYIQSSTSKKKLKLKKRLSKKLTHKPDLKKKDACSPELQDEGPSPPALKRSHKRKKSKSLSNDITHELAKVKLQCAESAHQLDQKNMEMTMLRQREEFALLELGTAKEQILVLQQKMRELSSCPECGHAHVNEGSLSSSVEQASDTAAGSAIPQLVNEDTMDNELLSGNS